MVNGQWSASSCSVPFFRCFHPPFQGIHRLDRECCKSSGMNLTPPPSSLLPLLQSAESDDSPVHALIFRLGYAGLIPFVVFTILAWLVNNDQALAFVALGMAAYAALIASFLGGLHWGVVWLRQSGLLGTAAVLDAATAKRHLLWGITPTLLAWLGVLMPSHAALPWLGMVLVLCYLVDRKLFPNVGLGPWLTLRFRLSVVAALSCFLAAGAV